MGRVIRSKSEITGGICLKCMLNFSLSGESESCNLFVAIFAFFHEQPFRLPFYGLGFLQCVCGKIYGVGWGRMAIFDVFTPGQV